MRRAWARVPRSLSNALIVMATLFAVWHIFSYYFTLNHAPGGLGIWRVVSAHKGPWGSKLFVYGLPDWSAKRLEAAMAADPETWNGLAGHGWTRSPWVGDADGRAPYFLSDWQLPLIEGRLSAWHGRDHQGAGLSAVPDQVRAFSEALFSTGSVYMLNSSKRVIAVVSPERRRVFVMTATLPP